MRFRVFLLISTITHAVIIASVAVPAYQKAMHFSVKKGIAAQKEEQKKKENRTEKKHRQRNITLIIASESEYSVQKPRERKKISENKTSQKHTSTPGALYKKAAHLLQNNPPHYPYISRQMNSEGTVILAITIGTDGRNKNVAIAQSSGDAHLDASAAGAVKEWRFFDTSEALLNNPITIRLPVIFRMK